MKKRYLVVGIGGRGIGMFVQPILKMFPDVAELAGLCDINLTRMKNVCKDLNINVPLFTDLDEALKKLKPDRVICCTRDSAHDKVIVKGLLAGCDVITEKPMTIDDARCRAILAAEKKSGRKVTVTFNYRYATLHTHLKRALMDGRIGQPYSADFNWYLDCHHGTDYFRRWHAHLANCGGLLVHKATHHFDLINWWLDDEPEAVFAFGARNVFGPGKRANPPAAEKRCMTCKNRCPYFWDITASASAKKLYVDTEQDGDRYIRDGCVFRDGIDIYDTMSVVVRYKGGKQLTYSLHAGLPYEGYRLAINGSKGRLDCFLPESGAPVRNIGGWEFTVTPIFSQSEGQQTFFVPSGKGGHGGGDPVLLEHVFRGGGEKDPYGRAAGSWAGAMSILIGVAANKSIATGKAVRIADLLRK